MKKIFFLALLGSLLSSLPVHAEAKMSEETRKKTALALDWLEKKQHDDGSFSDGSYEHNTAITGFAMLAFMSQGHLPNQGKHGPEVAKAARFLMAAQREGYIVGARGGSMYCHGMATLALSELWGQTGDDELKPYVVKAIRLIESAQTPEGGWRYKPLDETGDPVKRNDISLTIMQVMALRSAKNAGLHVRAKTLKDAINYIRTCECPLKETGEMGFSYQPKGSPGFARTAAGTCVLYLTGEYQAPEIAPAVKYMKKHFDETNHFYYGHYYAAHAMHQWGGFPQGAKDWEDWYKRLENQFVPHQDPEGCWSKTAIHFPAKVSLSKGSAEITTTSTEGLAAGQTLSSTLVGFPADAKVVSVEKGVSVTMNKDYTGITQTNVTSASINLLHSSDRHEVGPVYQTSIAVIILSVPANYLPSYTLR